MDREQLELDQIKADTRLKRVQAVVEVVKLLLYAVATVGGLRVAIALAERSAQ